MTINNDFIETLTEIWKKNIKADYENELFSYEADLQASFYMHLREKLDKNYKIYLEQEKFFKSYKPDIIVCNDEDKPRKIKCILELKYLPHTHYPPDLSDMDKLKSIHRGEYDIWIEGPSRTDEWNKNDQTKWDADHWKPHFIDDDTIFGFVLIAPESKFADQSIDDKITEFLEKNKNYLVLAGKTYTNTGESIFEVKNK